MQEPKFICVSPPNRPSGEKSPAISGSPFLNADGFFPGDHNVIDQWDADNFGGRFQPLRYTDVLITGSRISRRVIVDDNDAVSGVSNGWSKDFARMHQAVPQGPHSDLM